MHLSSWKNHQRISQQLEIRWDALYWYMHLLLLHCVYQNYQPRNRIDSQSKHRKQHGKLEQAIRCTLYVLYHIYYLFIYMIIYIWYWYSYTVIHIIYIYMYNCTCIESYVIWHPLMGIASRKSEKLIDFNQRRIRISKWMQKMKLPIGSMYGIFTHIYHKTEPNVPHAGQYIIHGSYGNTKYGAIIEPVGLAFVDESCFGWTVLNPSKQ